MAPEGVAAVLTSLSAALPLRFELLNSVFRSKGKGMESKSEVLGDVGLGSAEAPGEIDADYVGATEPFGVREIVAQAQDKSAFCSFLAGFLDAAIPVGESESEYVQDLLALLEQLEFADLGSCENDPKGDDDCKAVGLSEALGNARREVEADPAEAQRTLAVERTRYIRGLHVGSDVKPPFESLYLTPNDSLEGIASISGVYRKAGFQLLSESQNRPDSLFCELSFAAALFEEKAKACEAGNVPKMQETQCLISDFVVNHLGKWVSDFCIAAARETDSSVFRLVMKVMEEFVEGEKGECQRIG